MDIISKDLKRKIAAVFGTCVRFIEVASVGESLGDIRFVSVTYRGFRYLVEVQDGNVLHTYCGCR